MLTTPQMSEWLAYDRIEPIGGYREDFRFAQLCLLVFDIAQKAFGGKKRLKASIMDFMPWGPDEARKKVPDKPQTVDEMKAILTGIARGAAKAAKK